MMANTIAGVYLAGLVIYGTSPFHPLKFQALIFNEEIAFGTYACLTWVIPAESYPTYLRSYGIHVPLYPYFRNLT